MAIYVPGIEQSGPAIGQLTAAIMQKMHPNAALQDKMQLQLAMNPKLLQEWAKLEKMSPGIGERMGFGGLSGIIQAVPETAADTVERTTKDLAVKTGQQEAQNKSVEVDREAQINEQIMNMMKSDKTLTYDMALRRATGETASGRIVSQEEAKLAPILGKAKIANAELEITTDNLHRLVADRALMQFGDTEKTDFYDFAKQVARGKFDSAKLQNILMTPGAAEAMNMALQNVHFDREQSRLEALRAGSDDKLTYEQKYYMQKSYDMYDGSEHVGSRAAWEHYLRVGAAAADKEVTAIKEKPEDQRSPEERDLVAVHDKMADESMVARLKVAEGVNNNVGNAIMKIQSMANSKNPPDKSTLEQSTRQLNDVLAAKARVEGSPVYVAHYGTIDVPWGFDQEGLYFTDKNGKVVDQSAVERAVTPPDTSTTGGIDRAYMIVAGKSTDAEREAALASIERRPNGGKAIADAVRARLKTPAGDIKTPERRQSDIDARRAELKKQGFHDWQIDAQIKQEFK
jgi:hypothetical protein